MASESDTPASATATLGEFIPLYCTRILHIGCGDGSSGAILQGRGECEVHGVEWRPEFLSSAAYPLTSLAEGKPHSFSLPGMEGYFDCVLLSGTGDYAHQFEDVLRRAEPYLATDGCILFAAPKIAVAPRDVQSLAAAVEGADLAVYQGWDISDRTDRPTGLVMAVRKGYDPLKHARRLLQGGSFDNAFDILECIPEHLLENDELFARVECEKQLCIFYWEEQADPALRLHRFYAGQCRFYLAISKSPGYLAPYHMQAEMWRRIGHPDMAARTLRSIQHALPHKSTEEKLNALGPVPAMASPAEAAPRWRPGDWHPRILFLTHKHTDYGLDVLYDGLCTLLGDDAVVEYPHKVSLHGQEPEEIKHYPCLFEREGTPRSLDELEAELRAGAFDVIICGILERDSEPDEIQRLLAADPNLPVFVVDQQDDPYVTIQPTLEYLGRNELNGYFKREMLECVEYPPNAWPLPFAYPDSRIPEQLPAERKDNIFWAGYRNYGMRRLYLEHLERSLGIDFEGRWSQEAYVERMESARIGLDFFGGGYDTVRYWELAAHGCMLLAERKPIRIPDDFRHGETAIFFDDLPELESRLAYYLEHAEEAAAIAAAGHQHLREHHTGSVRASQLLARIAQMLGR